MRHYTAVLEIRSYGERGVSIRKECFHAQAANLEAAREEVFRQAKERFPTAYFVERSLTCERVRV